MKLPKISAPITKSSWSKKRTGVPGEILLLLLKKLAIMSPTIDPNVNRTPSIT